MARRRVFQTITGIGAVVVCVAMLSGIAGAKGAQDATITGPGIRGSLFVGNGSQNPAPVNVNNLAVATGTYYAMSSSGPSPIHARRPSGPLGPRYRIVYRMYTGADEVTPIRQDVYPFARAGCVTYTPRGQRAFDKTARSGWYTSNVQPSPYEGGTTSAAATELLRMAGIPDRSTSH
jgi:hypothetical protein